MSRKFVVNWIIFSVYPLLLGLNVKLLPIKARVLSVSEFIAIITIALLISIRVKLKLKNVVIFSFLFIFILFNIFFANSVIQFAQSYLLFIVYVLYFFLIYSYLKNNNKIAQAYINNFVKATFILALYGLFQLFIRKITGITFPKVVYPFGDFTFQRQPLYFAVEKLRSNSFFYEPNIFGMISIIGFLINHYYAKKIKGIYKMLFLLGILTTQSTTTYLMLLISFSLDLVCNHIKNIFKNNFKINKKLIYGFISLMLILTIFVSFNPFNITNVLGRLKEINIKGSSGYYRVVTPFIAAKFIVNRHPFGIGLGNIDYYLENPPKNLKRDMSLGGSSGQTIDNIFFGIIISFGVFGFIIISFLILIFYHIYLNLGLGMMTAYVFYYLGTGSFMYIEFWVILLIMLVSTSIYNKNQNNSKEIKN